MRIWAEIVGNICVRRFWATDEEAALVEGAVPDQPWFVEGADVTASQASWDAAQLAAANEVTRKDEIESHIQNDAIGSPALTLKQLAALNWTDFNTWWTNNVTNLNQLNVAVKRLTFLALRRWFS